LDLALEQIPDGYIETIEILVRAESAGATHGLIDYCREAQMRFSVGYELTEPVRAAILQIPEDAWVPALDRDGAERENGQVAEITDRVDLSCWPERCRVIVRRERPHPGAQLSFTDHDGHRFQAILTDQVDQNIAEIECRHRQRAHVEDRIRDDKDTGLAKFPFKEFRLNEVCLDPGAAARRRARQGRAQAAALPPVARRRPPRVLRTARQAAPAARLAMGQRARRRLPQAQSAPSRDRLTGARRHATTSNAATATPSLDRARDPPARRPKRATAPHQPAQSAPIRTLTHRNHRRTLHELTQRGLLHDPGWVCPRNCVGMSERNRHVYDHAKQDHEEHD